MCLSNIHVCVNERIVIFCHNYFNCLEINSSKQTRLPSKIGKTLCHKTQIMNQCYSLFCLSVSWLKCPLKQPYQPLEVSEVFFGEVQLPPNQANDPVLHQFLKSECNVWDQVVATGVLEFRFRPFPSTGVLNQCVTHRLWGEEHLPCLWLLGLLLVLRDLRSICW